MKLITLLGVGLLGLLLTAATEPPVEPLPVSSLGLPKKASVSDPPIARVSGQYPTPLWQFHHWGMQIKGNTVELIPYGINQQKANQMVVQVTVPFQLPKALTGLRPGKYTVVVKGKGKAFSAPLELTDAATEKGFPYLDGAELPKSVVAGQAATIKVSGNLPDAAWHPLKGEAKVADGIIWVYPWGERKRRVFAAEMLKSGDWSIALPKLPEGDYPVIIEGHNDALRRTLKVTAAPPAKGAKDSNGNPRLGHS